MEKQNLSERISILDNAIKQRKYVLAHIYQACQEYGELSDFGWFLTLGCEPLGMLTAVSNGKEFKKWTAIANQLEHEVQYLIQNRQLLAHPGQLIP